MYFYYVVLNFEQHIYLYQLCTQYNKCYQQRVTSLIKAKL